MKTPTKQTLNHHLTYTECLRSKILIMNIFSEIIRTTKIEMRNSCSEKLYDLKCLKNNHRKMKTRKKNDENQKSPV